MAIGIITGGRNLFKRVSESTQPESRLGVFGPHPGATPKYAVNKGARESERVESMARLFLDLPSNLVKTFIDSLPAESRALGRVLATVGGTGGSSGTGFVDFLMTRTNEPFREKAQIVDTLTDNYVAFYSGQEPVAFQYAGHLINTYQDDQRVWMLRIYRDILRGTQLAKRNMVARLRYDSFMVTGYMESLDLAMDSAAETMTTFSFTMRVKEIKVVTPALGYPTIVETPVVEGSILTRPESVGDTERVATVAREDEEFSGASPAADTDDDETDVREALSNTMVDPNVAVLDTDSGEFTVFNPQNLSNDGQAGLSNIRGNDQQLLSMGTQEDTDLVDLGLRAISPAAAAARRGLRSRGLRIP